MPALMSCPPRRGSVTCMNRTVSKAMAAVGLAAAVIGLAACAGTPTIGKSGAAHQAVTIITLQMPDGSSPDGVWFAKDVTRRSGGTLKVVIDPDSYASTVPANGARLVAALRAGRVGFSYQPARDWSAAGVPGFQALDTPFLVTTVTATEDLAASPVAAAVLRQLTPLGLVGIGLIPNEPRQFLSTRPLIGRPISPGPGCGSSTTRRPRRWCGPSAPARCRACCPRRSAGCSPPGRSPAWKPRRCTS